MKKSVWVIGNEGGYINMFLKNEWEVVDNPYDAEFIQFTGGSDVSPLLYKEEPHPTTHSSPKRDEREFRIFSDGVNNNKKLLGICRGAQFLNVMSGGSLWQNVNNHALGGTHWLADVETKTAHKVSSTHHQMMRVGPEGEVVATASLSTKKEGGTPEQGWEGTPEEDVEVVYYPHTSSLCFQPHPEYFDPEHSCQKYYFELINRYFLKEGA